MKGVTVAALLEAKGESLQLEPLNEGDLQREVRSPTVSNPGLVLAGYAARLPSGRVQILGETEISYLNELDAAQRKQALETFMALDIALLIITKNQEPPPGLIEQARAARVPVFRTALKTAEVYRRIQPFLELHFAERTTVHGSLADVYGIGLLFVGRSGIGKSECVLDLVERGHRLVADDAVTVFRHGNDVLMGSGNELTHGFMEIRGIGLIDIRALFGIRAIRHQKRIEVVVRLVDWNDGMPVDRTGLDVKEVEMLGVNLPQVIVPLNPGKNITVIAEVVAMNHLLKYSGVNSAQELNNRIIARTRREYLEQDYE